MRLLAAGLVLFAGAISPAYGASAAASVEVARVGAESLRAVDDEGRPCIAIDRRASFSCADTRAGVLSIAPTVKLVGAAVPASATSVEVRRGGILLASAPTVAGEAYRGVAAGALRFALVHLPDTARLSGVRVHALSASGTVEAVLAESGDALVAARRRLRSGRSARARWSLDTTLQSELAPSVLDIGHERLSRCVRVNAQFGDLSNSIETCASHEHAQSASVTHCHGFRLLHGVVSDSITGVHVVLGDGRRRTVRTMAVGDGLRAYALPTGRAAVRALVLMSAKGPVRVLRRALPPLAVHCAADEGGFDLGDDAAVGADEPPVVSPLAPVATVAGAPPLRVADGLAGELCLAIGDDPFRAVGCGSVSPWLGELVGTLDRYGDAYALAVAVPAQVQIVRISSPDGRPVRDLPTVAADGYAGPYAGHVRFAAATLAAVDELPRIELLDAAGTLMYGGADLANELEFEVGGLRFGTPRRVAGRAGAPSLWRTTARFEEQGGSCLALTGGARPSPDELCAYGSDDGAVLLHASCITHRLSVAAVGLAVGTRVLALVPGSEPRRIGLRNGSGLLTLPIAKPLRAVTFIRKGRTRRMRIDAPSATRQCGWSAAQDVAG